MRRGEGRGGAPAERDGVLEGSAGPSEELCPPPQHAAEGPGPRRQRRGSEGAQSPCSEVT